MNDRFKFRAWDKKMMRMITGNAVDNNGDPFAIHVNLDGSLDTTTWDGYHIYGTLIDSDDFVLMQSTGLKDKNGTLIYEGDVLETDHNKLRCVVFWESMDRHSSWSPKNEFYIIGNIYENPELMGGE